MTMRTVGVLYKEFNQWYGYYI